MSYYLLQKIKGQTLVPVISQRVMRNMTSTSVFIRCKDVQRELVNMCIYDGFISYTDIIQFVNPYEYVFSPSPQTKLPICTLKCKTNLYYELLEVFDLVDIKQTHKYSLLQTTNVDDVKRCLTNKIVHTKVEPNTKYGFVFQDINHHANLDAYVTEIVNVLMVLLKSQDDNGVAIIKVNYLFHRPILDVVYILSSMYEKVYIVKPNTSNAMSQEKYIVCLNKIPNQELYNTNYDVLSSKSNKRLYSLVDHNLPISFINKINDINVILGERQLEYLDKALTIMSSANKYDVVNDTITKNIQKSVSLCEKLGLPFVKTNIFLDKR